MRKILLFFIVIYCLSGCASINKFNTWQRHGFEKGAYADALNWYDLAVPESVLKECGYIFNAPIPPTIPVEDVITMIRLYLELEDNDPLPKLFSPPKGFYRPKTMEVFYMKGEFETLKHEYFHYMDDISNADEKCLKQIIAYFGVYGDKQRKAARKWRRAYRKERTRNIGR